MKKVLIITYYWPPSGGVGVQRWLKFAKYLPQFGWEPVIFTPENPDFNVRDEKLLQEISPELEVIKFPIWEPFQLFNSLTGNKNKNNIKQGVVLEKAHMGFKEKLSIWIRGNIFIPDPRVFWVWPSVKFLQDIIETNQISTIITTGPPHSMHLIGRALKKRTGVQWIADFRDPWSDWDLLDKLFVSAPARWMHRQLEQSVLKQADGIVTVTHQLTEAFKKLGARQVACLHNGVDLDGLPSSSTTPAYPEHFQIAYFGLLNEMRNPEVFWVALKELLLEHPDLAAHCRLTLGGIVSESILENLRSDEQLNAILDYRGYMAHQDIHPACQSSAVLLLLLNDTDNARWIVPMKLYEYMAAGRPILLLAPEHTDAGAIIEGHKAGAVVDRSDKNRIKNYLFACYEQYLQGKLPYYQHNLQAYSRKQVSQELALLLNKLSEPNQSSMPKQK